jgi:hypothetical protein
MPCAGILHRCGRVPTKLWGTTGANANLGAKKKPGLPLGKGNPGWMNGNRTDSRDVLRARKTTVPIENVGGGYRQQFAAAGAGRKAGR